MHAIAHGGVRTLHESLHRKFDRSLMLSTSAVIVCTVKVLWARQSLSGDIRLISVLPALLVGGLMATVAVWPMSRYQRVNVSPLWSDTAVHRFKVDVLRIHLKIAKKCCLSLNIFSFVKINVFRPFFAFRLKMHVRYRISTKLEQRGETTFWQPVLFECMGICALNPAHECEMRGSLVYLLSVKYLLILFKFS